MAEMRKIGVLPDIITYNAAISACEKGELLAEMRSVSVLPDVIIYNAAISVCEKSEQW